jgi:trigger factor
MTSTLTRLAPTQVALEFSITDEELAAAEDRAFRKLARNVRLPGFRKGKVPRKIFEQAYGSEAVTSQAVDEVAPEVYAKAVREHDLEPVERPQFEILEQADGRPKRLKATVEVRPEIRLGTYRGLKATRPPSSVSDEDVERSLEALARERATLVPVERPARLGDLATLDYQGTIDGAPFEGGTATGQTTELNEGRFVPGFVAGIVGMNPGETKSVPVRFPDEYPAKEVAGKDALFSITLHELKEIELPAMDDEFAQAVSANQTMADLRADLRRRLEAVADARSRRVLGNALLTELLSAHDFALPASMVETELDRMLEDAGPPPEQEQRSTEERRAAMRPEAESHVKAALLIEAIAKAENIVATPADIAAELEILARRYGQPVARIRKALGNNLLSLMDGIVRNKTLELLIDNAEVVADEETTRSAS